MDKALWIQDLDNNKDRVIRHIRTTGARKICVRTTAATLKQLLPTFQQQMGLKVFGWRWPHLFPNPNAKPKDPAHPDPKKDDSAYWPNEVTTVKDLIAAGLDGYIFDIESDGKKEPKDWDNPDIADRAQQAKDFASGIREAFKARGTPYVLGLTSHRKGFSNYPGIPWQSFLDVCHVLYPQTYWRFRDGNEYKNAAGGKPKQAVTDGYADYANKRDASGNLIPIIPIAGEINCITGDEVKAFMQAIAPHHPAEAHFYVDEDNALEMIGSV